MKFPERPTCHDKTWPKPREEVHWRSCNFERPGALATWRGSHRVCSYCHSIHPEDLLRILDTVQGSELTGADWKYGWPHKFGVQGVPNELAGQEVVTGRGPDGDIVGPAPKHCWVKWYNVHLNDEGYDDEAREAVMAALTIHSGIRWFLEEGTGEIKYAAPYPGYQRWPRAMQETMGA